MNVGDIGSTRLKAVAPLSSHHPSSPIVEQREFDASLRTMLSIFWLALVVSTTVGSWLIITFGPEPRSIQPTSDLWPDFPGTVLSEPSDRLLLIFWLAMGLLAVAGSILLVRSRRIQRSPRQETFAVWTLFAVTFLVVLVSLVRSTKPHDDWNGITPLALLLASLVTLAIAVVRRYIPRLWPLVNAIAGVIALGYLLGAGWQTHFSIRDPFHFGIALDDFMRGSTLAIPYVDYLPTYTAFLGHPLFFIQGLPGATQVLIATYWMLFLQVAVVVLALALVRSASGPGSLGISALLLVSPIVFAQVGTGQSALQSAPVIPSRVLLPLVGFLLLVWSWRRPGTTAVRWSWRIGLAGVVLGASAINNVEFGATALAAAFVTAAVREQSLKSGLGRILSLAAGVILVVGLFLASSALSAGAFDPLNLLRIQLIYASAGYDLHAIVTLGPFLAFTVVSLIATSVGVVQIRILSLRDRTSVRGQVLLLIGLWMLLSLGYFAGRSFTSVLFAGLSVQLGILLASLAGFAWDLIPRFGLSVRGISAFGWIVVSLVPVFIGLSLVFGGSSPQRMLAFGQSGSPVVDLRYSDFNEIRDVITRNDPAIAETGTYLIVGPSAVSSRIAGMQDGTVMSRVFLNVSRTLMEFQCQRLPSGGALVVESSIADRINSLRTCVEQLELVEADVPVANGPNVSVYRIKER